MSAIDALRSGFTGRIIIVPSSSFGAFENTDIMKRQFGPLSKNQCYYVEDDYLDRANIDILRGSIKSIDIEKGEMAISGLRKPVKFSKMLVAWGSDREKLSQSYGNVHYIEDRFSHAKIHNQLIKSKSVVVLGNTFEAMQTAQSAREYLDNHGYFDTKIVLMTTEKSEIRQTLGKGFEDYLMRELREQRISYQPNVNVTNFEGENDLEKIYYNKEGEYEENLPASTEYFIPTDMIICENGIGRPKKELLPLVGHQD